MNRTAGSLLTAGLAGTLTAALTAAVATGTATAARASSVAPAAAQGPVPGAPAVVAAAPGTAEDDARVIARAAVPTAVAGLPRGIVVTDHRGRPVAISAPGTRTQVKPRPGSAPAVFRDLTVGRTYTVTVGGAVIGRVLVVDAPAAADGLVVRATGSPSAVDVAWTYTPQSASGPVSFEVTASAPGRPIVRVSVTDATSARLTGLDPHALYAFTVTPRNSAGTGGASSAAMTRTLAEVVGRDSDVVIEQVKKAKEAPAPDPAPAPTGPSTRTIWVCPDGYADAGALCTKTMAYTYATLAYTFHTETSPGGPCNYLPNPSSPTGLDIYCPPPNVSTVKDATPAGYTDNGSAWVKRDPMPSGYTDDGTQWVTSTAKVSREVPS